MTHEDIQEYDADIVELQGNMTDLLTVSYCLAANLFTSLVLATF